MSSRNSSTIWPAERFSRAPFTEKSGSLFARNEQSLNQTKHHPFFSYRSILQFSQVFFMLCNSVDISLEHLFLSFSFCVVSARIPFVYRSYTVSSRVSRLQNRSCQIGCRSVILEEDSQRWFSAITGSLQALSLFWRCHSGDAALFLLLKAFAFGELHNRISIIGEVFIRICKELRVYLV